MRGGQRSTARATRRPRRQETATTSRASQPDHRSAPCRCVWFWRRRPGCARMGHIPHRRVDLCTSAGASQRHLRRADIDAQCHRPACGDDGEHLVRVAVACATLLQDGGSVVQELLGLSHATPPFVSSAHISTAMASASLSSTGLKPRARAAAIIACFGALPLPVAWRLMVPTGTPS